MKFLVQRASDGDARHSPVPCAEHIPLVEQWRNGEHRSAWAIEIGTLEDFIAFTKQHGDCVLMSCIYCTSDYTHQPYTAQDQSQQWLLNEQCGILIYDDHIE